MSKKQTVLTKPKPKKKTKKLLFTDRAGKELGRFTTVSQAAKELGFTDYAVRSWINGKVKPARGMKLEIKME